MLESTFTSNEYSFISGAQIDKSIFINKTAHFVCRVNDVKTFKFMGIFIISDLVVEKQVTENNWSLGISALKVYQSVSFDIKAFECAQYEYSKVYGITVCDNLNEAMLFARQYESILKNG